MLLQGIEQVVDRHRSHIISGFAAISPAATQRCEICALAEQHVPRVEITVHLAQSVSLALKSRVPFRARLLEIGKEPLIVSSLSHQVSPI